MLDGSYRVSNNWLYCALFSSFFSLINHFALKYDWWICGTEAVSQVKISILMQCLTNCGAGEGSKQCSYSKYKVGCL